jgi:hypothetical protein
VAPFPMFALVLFIRRQDIFGAFADTRFMDLAAIPAHRRHRGPEHLPLLHTSGSPYPGLQRCRAMASGVAREAVLREEAVAH